MLSEEKFCCPITANPAQEKQIKMSETIQTTIQSEVLQQFPLVVRIESGPYAGNQFNIATPRTLVRGQNDNQAQCVIYRGWDAAVVQDIAGNTAVNGNQF